MTQEYEDANGWLEAPHVPSLDEECEEEEAEIEAFEDDH